VKLNIIPKRITLYLSLGVVFLYLATLACGFFGMVGLRDGTILGELLGPFDMTRNDLSIAAWYSSVLMLLCSILLAVIAVSSWQRPAERYTLHWGVLSGIFLLMSVDEVARLHETFGEASERALVEFAGLTPEGFLYFFWVVPGAIFVLIVGLGYVRFLAQLPGRTLALFVAAATIFVGGAMGLEMVEAALSFDSAELGQNVEPEHSLSWWIVRLGMEELFEFVGILIFCYALLSYLGSYATQITVEVRPTDHGDTHQQRSKPRPGGAPRGTALKL
jgi:hypothetical protein